jgi:hypothetical protein
LNRKRASGEKVDGGAYAACLSSAVAAWAKLVALADGAKLAARELWR